ncbi:L,D-transpeptidase [Pantanalinema rosaneae CENA516]|uniref:L,D-transpeptidase n=1 Tax=Pantanalinema rosaneae TaxID=1620701 RepID=UPI003D6EB58A
MKSRLPLSWFDRIGRLVSSLVLLGSLQLVIAPERSTAQGGVVVAQATQIAEAVTSLKQSNDRWIEIKLSSQRLIAWEGGIPVYAVIVSTGKSSTPTVKGVFAIQTRHRYARMQGDDYDVPDVPYTMYYYRGYAIHGAYWHNNFGTPVSHGCVNVAVNHAGWLYDWAKVGTPVVVRD